jgi:hypothetical protein
MGIIEKQNTRLLLDFPKRNLCVDDSERQATVGRTIVGGMNLATIL